MNGVDPSARRIILNRQGPHDLQFQALSCCGWNRRGLVLAQSAITWRTIDLVCYRG
jgi:hypothetical protein